MKAILIDTTRCTGCAQCVQACTEAHQLPPRLPARLTRGDGLSSRRLTALVPLAEGGFAKKQCLHCSEPGCVSACPVGAIEKTSLGAVVYDKSRCMGCRYCMLACPVGIPRYEWEKQLPYMVKCDLCQPRLEKGEPPACTAACKNGVLAFGERDAMLQEARKRISRHPSQYVNHIYGERELGGTAVLYLANQPLDVLGWPSNVGERTLASYTWPLISKTPWMALGVGGFLVGAQLIIQRRMQLEANPEDENAATKSGTKPSKDDDSQQKAGKP